MIIVDNASIHKSNKVKRYLGRHDCIKLFCLPTYSPEYNPVEIFWKWIKPKVHGFKSVCGIEAIINSLRKLVWHYNNGRLPNQINFKLETYKDIL
jgi:transposase